MIYLLVFGGIAAFILLAWLVVPEGHDPWPDGYTREYDPDGDYTYRDQNPKYAHEYEGIKS